MSVLKGEGRVPILFGSTSISVGPKTLGGYLARPDLTGEWPTVLVVPSVWGVTSSVKDLCRRLARRGLAAIAPDFHRGGAPDQRVDHETAAKLAAMLPMARAAADLGDVVEYIANPAGFWSSAEHGFAVLGAGQGGTLAVDVAVAHGAQAVGLVAAPLDEAVAHGLGAFPGGVLGLYGRDDEVVAIDGVLAARSDLPHAEIVVYEGVGHDFIDDLRPTFDQQAATDAIERLSIFFVKHLPPGPA
jgi:carboxymethylenebutenolidase